MRVRIRFDSVYFFVCFGYLCFISYIFCSFCVCQIRMSRYFPDTWSAVRSERACNRKPKIDDQNGAGIRSTTRTDSRIFRRKNIEKRLILKYFLNYLHCPFSSFFQTRKIESSVVENWQGNPKSASGSRDTDLGSSSSSYYKFAKILYSIIGNFSISRTSDFFPYFWYCIL